ncbi:hypothetical protein Tco_0014633 [Tanacetum coccineum]
MQGVSKTDFENYVKANDAVLRNMQNQGQGLQNQMTNLTEMLSKFITSNTASSSNSKTLPSQTVTNPREHVNAITTRSGKTYEGPSTPLVPIPAAKKTVQEPDSPEPNSYQPKLPYPERMKVRERYTQCSAEQRLKFSDPEETKLMKSMLFLPWKFLLIFEAVFIDSEGDVIFLENLLSDDTTHNLAPEVISNHEPNESIHNTSITFSPRNDPLHHEFAGEFLTLPSRISIPVSLTPVEDNDPVQEEIDIFLVPDDLIPPGVENDDSEDEENESFILEPSSLRPSPEPPDVCLNFKPDTAMKNDEEIVLSLNVEEYFFTFVIWTYLSHFSPTPRILLLFSLSEVRTSFLTPASLLFIFLLS